MSGPSKHWNEYRNRRGQDQVIQQALNIIDFHKLCDVASDLCGNGKRCDANTTTFAFGGVNIVFEVIFEDEVVWIARIRFPDDCYPKEGVDSVLESEVTTMQYLRQRTAIPVPCVYGYDSRFGNDIGMPYILMEAMPGQRLWGGGRADFIPDEYKRKVYSQIVDVLLDLYNHPFDNIGMLFPDVDGKHGVRIGPIFDQHHRLEPYGPFSTSLEFYRTRATRLNLHRRSSNPSLSAQSSQVIAPRDEPDAILRLVDPNYNDGPFYLTHPDFQISNFLFDDEYNITALLDWSGCQTLPFESFANPPSKIIPDADEFLDGWAAADLLSDNMRIVWGKRRQLFLKMLEDCEIARSKTSAISRMMKSPRSYFAAVLDWEGILGIPRSLPKKEFDQFCPD
jgi:aminoglycoside phosphotransferase (APT) family kinase protein